MTLSAARIAVLARKLGLSEECLARAYAESAEATRSEAIKQSWKKPEVREKRRAGIKASWSDPQRKERWLESLRVANADPTLRLKRSTAAKRRYEEGTARAALAEQGRRAAADPDVAAQKSVAMKARRADPAKATAWAVNSAEGKRTPAARARQSEAMKASWAQRRAAEQALIDAAIAAGRVTRCPTAAVMPTMARISEADNAALTAYAQEQDDRRRADYVAHSRRGGIRKAKAGRG